MIPLPWWSGHRRWWWWVILVLFLLVYWIGRWHLVERWSQPIPADTSSATSSATSGR